MSRLVSFWRQGSRRGKTLLVVAVVMAVIAVLGAVTGRDDEANVASEATGATSASEAMRCLQGAGLSEVEEQAAGLWRGFHDGPFYTITVRKLATPARAPEVVAGTYVVTGRFKVAAKGEGLTSAEGLQADLLVQLVADCLRG